MFVWSFHVDPYCSPGVGYLRDHFCRHTISVRLAEIVPHKCCCISASDGLCRPLGRSNHHRSYVKVLPVGLLLHVAEQDASYLHPYVYPPLFLPQDKCTL